MVTIAEAQNYFNERLNTEAWDLATSENKTKALAQAERDINNVNLTAIPGDVLIHAICEQAIFLLSLTPADMERRRAIAIGVKFRNVKDAREDYYSRSNISLLATEAEALLTPYIRIHRRMGHIR